MAEKFEEFIEEVRNDIRNENLIKIWNRYGKVIIGIVVAIFLGVTIKILWKNYETRQRLLQAQQFITAHTLIEKGEKERGIELLTHLDKNAVKAYSLLSKFFKGALLQEKKEKPEEIISLYNTILNHSSIDTLYKELARLNILYIKLSSFNEKTPKHNYENLLEELNKEKINNPIVNYFILEMKGFLLYKLGKPSEAKDVLSHLARQENIPGGLLFRVQLMLQGLSVYLGE